MTVPVPMVMIMIMVMVVIVVMVMAMMVEMLFLKDRWDGIMSRVTSVELTLF